MLALALLAFLPLQSTSQHSLSHLEPQVVVDFVVRNVSGRILANLHAQVLKCLDDLDQLLLGMGTPLAGVAHSFSLSARLAYNCVMDCERTTCLILSGISFSLST